MSLLSGIGNWLRNTVDDVGSLITGQPAHSPVPTPPPAPSSGSITLGNSPNLPPFHPSTMAGQILLQNINNKVPTVTIGAPPQQNVPQAPRQFSATPNLDNKPNLLHQALGVGHGVLDSLLNTDKSMVQGANAVYHVPANVAKLGIANLTDNQQAADNARQQIAQAQHATGSLLQFPAQAGAQVGTSLGQLVNKNAPGQFTPQGAVLKTLTGNQPVPSLQTQFKNVQAQFGTPEAIGSTVFSGLMDVANLAGALKGLKTGGEAAVKGVRQLNDTARTTALQTASQGSDIQMIPLAKLVSHEGAPDTARVAQYKLQLQNGQPVDPLIGMPEGNKIGVADGQHRLAAMQQLGIQEAPVRVVQPNTVAQVLEGGYVKVPGVPDEPLKPELPPFERTPDEEFMQSVASEYPSSEQFIKETADAWRREEEGKKGGYLVPDGEAYGYGKVRATDHGTFYRNYFAENGRAPSQQAWRDEVQRQLEHGGGNIVMPDEAAVYKIIKDREAANAALDNAPQAAPKDKQMIKVLKKSSTEKQLPVYSGKGVQISDKVMANSLGISPAKAKTLRIEKQTKTARNLDAERAALEHLRKGGLRDEAVKIYQKISGSSERMSQYRVRLAAKQAEQSLNPNEKSANPLEGKFKPREVKAGDYEDVRANYRSVSNTIDNATRQVMKFEKKLSDADKANFIDYVQGVKDISVADNPALVEQAMVAWRNLADSVHALDRAYGGKTAHIKDFFPQYWDRNDPKIVAAIENAGGRIEEIRARNPGMTSEEAYHEYVRELQARGAQIPEDTGNYSGFHAKGRIFATQAEGREAGYMPMNENPFDDIRRYVTGAKLTIGEEALKRSVAKAEMGAEAPRRSIDLPTGNAIRVSEKGYKQLRDLGLRKPIGIIRRGYLGLSRSIIKTIVANPLIHGGNQEFNALFNVAWKTPGFKPANMIRLIRDQVKLADSPELYNKWRTEFYSNGGFSPTYGRDSYGFIAKGLQKAGVDPALAELSPRGMAALEENIRVGLFKNARERGMDAKTAITNIDKALGNSKILDDMSGMVGLFWHYMMTNVKLLGDVGVQATKGNFMPLIGLAVGYAAWTAANKAWQEATGNPDASVRPAGMLSTAIQIAKAPSQAKRGQIPSIVVSHTNPALSFAISSATNRDLRKPVFGPSAANNTIRGPQGEGFGQLAEKTLLGPGQTIQRTQAGQQSPGEAVLSTVTGLYTPHAKGSQAAPNIPILNTPNAQSGTGIAARDNYFKAQDAAYNVLGNNQKNIDLFNSYRDSERDPNNPNIILGRSPAENLNRWSILYSNDTVRTAIQTMEKQLPNHDPIWDLPADRLKVAVDYEKQYAGDPERTRLEEKYGDWLPQFIQSRAAWQQSQTYTGQYQPSPETPQYPNISSQTQTNLNTYFNTTDSTARGEFLSTHPDVTQALNQLSQYTNQMRIAQGALPLQTFPVESDHVKAILDSMPKGNDAASKKARAIAITGNPDVNQYLADVALYTTSKNLAGYFLQINPNITESQELNSGSAKAQQTLKDIVSMGKYDIGINPSTGQYSYLQNGTFEPGTKASGSSGGGSSKSKRHPLYFRRKPKKVYKIRTRRPHIRMKIPPNPIKIKNKVSQHPGIKRTTLL